MKVILPLMLGKSLGILASKAEQLLQLLGNLVYLD